MNRKQVPKGKLVRRFGVNIFGSEKYDRLLKRKPHPPGVHGVKRRRGKKVSEYGRQLIEKQKIKFAYGVSESQLRGIFSKAKHSHGVTGSNILSLLERRLDNVVYRLGIASSRSQARQFVSHGHVHLNGRRLNVPSASVRVGDQISFKQRDNITRNLRSGIDHNSKRICPLWLELDADALKAKIIALPQREDVEPYFNEQFLVEYYAQR